MGKTRIKLQKLQRSTKNQKEVPTKKENKGTKKGKVAKFMAEQYTGKSCINRGKVAKSSGKVANGSR